MQTAVAVRVVMVLSEMETMCADPVVVRWVSLGVVEGSGLDE